MVGRTPEYVGKNIGPTEIKVVMLYTLVAPLAMLLLTAAVAVATAPASPR